MAHNGAGVIANLTLNRQFLLILGLVNHVTPRTELRRLGDEYDGVPGRVPSVVHRRGRPMIGARGSHEVNFACVVGSIELWPASPWAICARPENIGK